MHAPSQTTRSSRFLGSSDHWPSAAVLICTSLLIVGCADDGTGPDHSRNGFSGKVEGTNAFISLVVGDERVAAYVCNGDEEIAEYFWGPVESPTELSVSNSDGAELAATLVDGVFSGEVTLAGGSSHTFEATVSDDAEAGMWVIGGNRAVEDEVAGGWVLSNDGEVRGALLRSSRFEPTPTFDSAGLTLQENTYTVLKLVVKDDGSIAPNNTIATEEISTGGSGGEDRITVPTSTGNTFSIRLR